MKRIECEYESEVLAATLQSRWPDRVDAQLRTHVAGCAICSDVVVIAGSIEEAREEIWARAVVPDSGHVWRLAQLRVRHEAAKAAGRPITAAQVIAFACAAGLLSACYGTSWTWFHSALGRVTTAVADLQLQQLLPSATTLITEHGALVLAVGAMLITIPAAVYLAILKD
jgi:hypothetical protein